MKCFFCSKGKLSEDRVVFDFDTGERYSLLRCNICFGVYTYPRLNKEKLKEKYKQYREEKRGGRFKFIFDDLISKWHLRRPNTIFKILNSKGRILDIGCGRGIELSHFKKAGWDVLGTELQNNHNLELPIIDAEIWDLKLRPKSCDVIMFLHSLEHVVSPKKALVSVNKLLKKDGLFMIAVPNYDSLERRIFGKNWFHFDVPRHYSHFSKKFFEKWARENNYKILKTSYIAPEYDFYSVLQGVLNSLPFPNNLLYDFLLIKKKLTLRQKSLLFLQVPFLLPSLIFLLMVPVLWATHQSGTIELIMQKEE